MPVLHDLNREVSSLIDDLDVRLYDLLETVRAANLGPESATIEVMISSIAEEYATRTTALSKLVGIGPLIAWREMARLVAEGLGERDLPDWSGPAFRQVASILSREEFPCIFARQANRLKSGWICFTETLDTDEGKEVVRRGVLAYLQTLEQHPRERTVITPLLVIVKPVHPTLRVQEYRDQAWSLFQYLHEHDPEPWPIDVPTDPDRGDWSFCFGGVQLFSNVSDPAHKLHKSRNLGDSLVFAMQPRTNFDLVAGNNRKGRIVRSEIRARAEAYEGRPIKNLGFYGTPENREWKQMATEEGDDSEYPKTCPFHFKSGDKRSAGQ